MSSRFKNIFLIISGLAISFTLGAYFVLNIFTSLRNAYAKVTFVDKSDKVVKNIDIITYDSVHIKLNKIEIGDSKIVYIPVYGEGDYKVDIFLTNGDTMFCGAYIESGYNITEIITDNEILNNTKFY